MKILWIAALLLGLLLSYAVGLNYVLGFNLNKSLAKTMNPFRVMEIAEFIVFLVLIFFLFLNPVRTFFKKEKK